MADTLNYAKHLNSYILKMRKYFHMHPELSGMEENTSKKIILELEKLNVEYKKLDNYSVIAFINPQKKTSAKTLAFRANMDALPISENSEYPFPSKVNYISHMSGHDISMAIFLGIIKYAKENEEKINGRLIFVFEANDLTFEGSKVILNSNYLEGSDYIYSMHDLPQQPTGTLCLSPGFQLVGSDTIHITWQGEHSPSSFAFQARDTILAAAHFTDNIKSQLANKIDPNELAMITITEFLSGGFHNIIQDNTELTLNLRYKDNEVKKQIHHVINEFVDIIQKQFNVSAKTYVTNSTKPLINNQEAYELAYNSALKIVNKNQINDFKPTLNTESFSNYLEKYPGAFLFYGSTAKNQTPYTYFSDKYNPDENSFMYASTLIIQMIKDYFHID